MGVTVGFLVLFAFGASWACDARELTMAGLYSRTVTFDVSVLQITRQESEGKVKASEEVGRNENVCELCEEFAAEAFEYLQENKTQTEIVEMLHQTCSRLLRFEQQCITLVDYYVPLFFLEIESVQPEVFCQKVNLCEQMVITSLPQAEDKCEACHRAVAEVILKLKDPDTQDPAPMSCWLCLLASLTCTWRSDMIRTRHDTDTTRSCLPIDFKKCWTRYVLC